MTELRSLPPPRRTDFRVWRQIPTRWLDNDHYGHVNNAVYYSWFDTAINGFLLEAVGGDIRNLPSIGVVAETGCRYLSELSFPDVIEVGVGLERTGTSSVAYRLGVFRGTAERASAMGRFVHVYVDRQTRQVSAIPENIRAALSRL
jgi:acyl-CoA thioester hydrolase